MHNKRRFVTVDDMTILAIGEEIAELEKFAYDSNRIILLGGIVKIFDELPDAKDFSGRFTFSEAHFSFESEGIGSVALIFRRAVGVIRQSDPRQVDYVPSEKYIEIEINLSPNPNSWSQHQEVIDGLYEVLDKYLSRVDLSEDGAEDLVSQLASGFAASSKAMMDDLRAAELSLEERRRNLDDEFLEKERQRQEDHDAKIKELDGKIEEFERQSHMAERRRLLRAMSDQAVSDGIGSQLPSRMVLARWAVFCAALMGAVLAAWMSISGFQQLTSDPAVLASGSSTYWVLLGKGVLSSAIAVFSIVFAVNWMKNFYEDDVEFSQKIIQFNYDINRASWIIETILEVQHEAKGEVPETWIERVTSNLFGARGSSGEADIKSELADTLLGVSGSMKVGPDGPMLEFSRRDLGKLKKQLDALNEQKPP